MLVLFCDVFFSFFDSYFHSLVVFCLFFKWKATLYKQKKEEKEKKDMDFTRAKLVAKYIGGLSLGLTKRMPQLVQTITKIGVLFHENGC